MPPPGRKSRTPATATAATATATVTATATATATACTPSLLEPTPRGSSLQVADDALALIGQTPLVRLPRLSPPDGGVIYAKLEFKNPAGSVKDRAALCMVLLAEREGELHPGATIIEATSGNTGISLAMIAAVRGYRCVVVMPEDMSVARRHVLRAYGAEIVLTPAEESMSGAVARAKEIAARTPGSWMSRQFENPANPGAHVCATGLELCEQTRGKMAAFVAGVGTGGTITGCGRVLRERLGGAVRIVAVEPAGSAVLSGGAPGLHGIQGIGAGFVPAILDRSLIDEVVTVTDVAAERMARRIAREEGLLVGPSSGANVHAAVEVARRIQGVIVTILCDSGERYLFEGEGPWMGIDDDRADDIRRGLSLRRGALPGHGGAARGGLL